MKKTIQDNIGKWILIFVVLGPVFDLLTSISIHILEHSLTLINGIKILFLVVLIYDLIFISKSRYKRTYILINISIIIYIGLFAGMILYQKGPNVFVYECQNMMRTFFFPIALLACYRLYQEKRLSIDWKLFYRVLLIYLIFIIVPTLTHTGFDSYAHSKIGTIGWFYSANEIGGILSILLPFLICYILKQKWWIQVIGFIGLLMIYFSIGTKVPILSFMIVMGVLIVTHIIKWVFEKRWERIGVVGIALVFGIISILMILPKTSFYKNIIIHLNFLEIHSISDLLTIDKIDHFVYSERITFMSKTMGNYIDAPISQKLFGIGYIENYGTDQINLKTIEMDYYDVFFRHGIVGCIIYFIPLFFILWQIWEKIKMNKISVFYSISIILILLLSLFSGHILTAPSVSILVAIILVGLLNKEELS